MEGIKIEVGEVRENNKGTKMKIIRCNGNDDIDVEFLDDFHYIKRNNTYNNFVRGQIKNPYDKTLYGIGYIGHGKYKPSINKQNTPAYNQWVSMLERCYCEKRRYRTKTYANCEVCDEWHNFQNFAEWFYANHYDCNERLHVDKDILIPGNHIYSPETCLLVPQKLNAMFMNKCNKRGLPNGIIKQGNHYVAKYNEQSLGKFATIEEAYSVYAKKKKEGIAEAVHEYKNIIPLNVYQAILNHEFRIEDDVNYMAG